MLKNLGDSQLRRLRHDQMCADAVATLALLYLAWRRGSGLQYGETAAGVLLIAGFLWLLFAHNNSRLSVTGAMVINTAAFIVLLVSVGLEVRFGGLTRHLDPWLVLVATSVTGYVAFWPAIDDSWAGRKQINS